ncbi:MAG: hypothetical protein OEQ29_13700 [Alphaproteobacteria bacterium]|nr:hypothetical protein [Alphaproteobacteria bacterium]
MAVAVADTLGLGTGNPAVDLWLGIGSHLGLAVLIGIGLTTIIRSRWCRLPSASAEAFAVVGLLVAIWGFNFFILLPVANPAFVQIMPYEITFLSKVLFGVAAAGVLYAERSWRSVLLGWAELGARFGRSNA